MDSKILSHRRFRFGGHGLSRRGGMGSWGYPADKTETYYRETLAVVRVTSERVVVKVTDGKLTSSAMF